ASAGNADKPAVGGKRGGSLTLDDSADVGESGTDDILPESDNSSNKNMSNNPLSGLMAALAARSASQASKQPSPPSPKPREGN
ncbi:MAG: hypothetical protein ACK55I_49195, partial [bacterium]